MRRRWLEASRLEGVHGGSEIQGLAVKKLAEMELVVMAALTKVMTWCGLEMKVVVVLQAMRDQRGLFPQRAALAAVWERTRHRRRQSNRHRRALERTVHEIARPAPPFEGRSHPCLFVSEET